MEILGELGVVDLIDVLVIEAVELSPTGSQVNDLRDRMTLRAALAGAAIALAATPFLPAGLPVLVALVAVLLLVPAPAAGQKTDEQALGAR